MPKSTALQEKINLAEAHFDPSTRTLQDVILIKAGMSLNRRHYSEALLQAAAPKFEGVKSYDDHSWQSRGVGEITGWYRNVRYEDGALKADRTFSNTQAGQNVRAIVEDMLSGLAPRDLAGLSVSIYASGKLVRGNKDEDDYFEVESIEAAESVDDVTSPAAGGAYMVAGLGEGILNLVLADASYEDWQAARSDYTERLKNELKSIRQTEALKAAQADTERAHLAVQELQAELAQVRSELETATSSLVVARREAAVDLALLQAKGLPEEWKADLRKTLLQSTPSAWRGIMENEIRKAQSVKLSARPRVGGASQLVSGAEAPPPLSLTPRPSEDVVAWQKRIESQTKGNSS